MYASADASAGQRQERGGSARGGRGGGGGRGEGGRTARRGEGIKGCRKAAGKGYMFIIHI